MSDEVTAVRADRLQPGDVMCDTHTGTRVEVVRLEDRGSGVLRVVVREHVPPIVVGQYSRQDVIRTKVDA